MYGNFSMEKKYACHRHLLPPQKYVNAYKPHSCVLLLTSTSSHLNKQLILEVFLTIVTIV